MISRSWEQKVESGKGRAAELRRAAESWGELCAYLERLGPSLDRHPTARLQRMKLGKVEESGGSESSSEKSCAVASRVSSEALLVLEAYCTPFPRVELEGGGRGTNNRLEEDQVLFLPS